MKYEKQKKFKKAFRLNELDFIDFPAKISNVKISRIINCDKMGGCPYCFPHGYDMINSTQYNYQRNWKKYRKRQWKSE